MIESKILASWVLGRTILHVHPKPRAGLLLLELSHGVTVMLRAEFIVERGRVLDKQFVIESVGINPALRLVTFSSAPNMKARRFVFFVGRMQGVSIFKGGVNVSKTLGPAAEYIESDNVIHDEDVTDSVDAARFAYSHFFGGKPKKSKYMEEE